MHEHSSSLKGVLSSLLLFKQGRRLGESTEGNEGMETSQTFSSTPWALGGNGTVNSPRGYLGAGRERARGQGATSASGSFSKDQSGFKSETVNG